MINKYMKVEGHTNYYRDPVTKAIIIVDETKRQDYINQRTLAIQNAQNTEHINMEVNKLKQDVNDMKQSLNMIINILNKIN